MKKSAFILSVSLASCLLTTQAAFLSYTLPGISDFDAWDDLSISNPQVASASPAFPGFPGSTAWSEAIDSLLTQGTPVTTDDDPTGDATFNKLSGNGYPASTSIYASPFPPAGTFTVQDTTPVANLEQVIFQIEIGNGSAGWLAADPTLTVNGGSTTVPLFDSGTVSSVFDPAGPFGPVTVNTLAYQWDLSSIAGPISDFNVTYTVDGTRTTAYQLQLDQGDTFSAQMIPEPSSILLIVIALGAGLILKFRRCVQV